MVRALFSTGAAPSTISRRGPTDVAGGSVADLGKEFESLCGARRRPDKVERSLETKKEYFLGTKNYPVRPGYTVENQIHSGILTALMRLVSSRVSPRAPSSCPPGPHPYTGALEERPGREDQALRHGHLLCLPEQRHVYVHEVRDARGRDCLPDHRPQRPRRGGELCPGSWQRHWGFFMITPRKSEGTRQIFRCDLEAKGVSAISRCASTTRGARRRATACRSRSSSISGRPRRAQKRTVYFEPVTLDSPRRAQDFAVRGYLLWQPENEKSACTATLRFTQVDIQPASQCPEKR